MRLKRRRGWNVRPRASNGGEAGFPAPRASNAGEAEMRGPCPFKCPARQGLRPLRLKRQRGWNVRARASRAGRGRASGPRASNGGEAGMCGPRASRADAGLGLRALTSNADGAGIRRVGEARIWRSRIKPCWGTSVRVPGQSMGGGSRGSLRTRPKAVPGPRAKPRESSPWGRLPAVAKTVQRGRRPAAWCSRSALAASLVAAGSPVGDLRHPDRLARRREASAGPADRRSSRYGAVRMATPLGETPPGQREGKSSPLGVSPGRSLGVRTRPSRRTAGGAAARSCRPPLGRGAAARQHLPRRGSGGGALSFGKGRGRGKGPAARLRQVHRIRRWPPIGETAVLTKSASLDWFLPGKPAPRQRPGNRARFGTHSPNESVTPAPAATRKPENPEKGTGNTHV